MSQLIVWLEIDGVLKKCLITGIWADRILSLQGLLRNREELLKQSAIVASQIVQSGEYQIRS